MSPRVKLSSYLERTAEAGQIIIEIADDEDVIVPPAELWPDEAYDALREGEVKDAARHILGNEAYERFTAHGGSWRVLNGIVAEVQAMTVGESSASSPS